MIKTSNEVLRDDVLAELDSEPRVHSERIGVAADGGLVTLTGSVDSLAEKWAAEEAVRRVRGVRAIVEEIAVDIPHVHDRGDADIARAVTSMLEWDAALPRTIQVIVQHGWITLTGEVPWHYQRLEAEHVVRRAAGIKGVTNSIVLQHSPAETDVSKEVHRRLHRNALVDADNIVVHVAGGGVTLSGTVRSWFEREEAARAAWSIKGVTAVHNDVAVV